MICKLLPYMVTHVLHFSLSLLTRTAWIRVYYSGLPRSWSLVSISDCNSICVEADWAGCVWSNTQTHDDFLAVIHFSLRNAVRVIARKPLLLKVQNDIPFIMHEKSVTLLVFLERRWLYRVFQGQYLRSLSTNYVAINKELEKLLPPLY